MLTVVIVIHLMLVVALIGVVLLQKSEGGGLVSGSNSSGFMTGRGTANVLSRTTAVLAAGFFVTSLALSWLASFERKPSSIINGGAPTTQETPVGAPPAAPLSRGGNGVLNQLGGGAPPANGPAAPNPAPSGPQVPQSQ
jgi:preprotein translocase subunit SecG